MLSLCWNTARAAARVTSPGSAILERSDTEVLNKVEVTLMEGGDCNEMPTPAARALRCSVSLQPFLPAASRSRSARPARAPSAAARARRAPAAPPLVPQRPLAAARPSPPLPLHPELCPIVLPSLPPSARSSRSSPALLLPSLPLFSRARRPLPPRSSELMSRAR